MFETSPAVKMSDEQKRILEAWAQAPRTPQKIVLRSRICLLAAQGKPNQVIARELKTSRPTVILWRKRFEAGGSAGIAEDAPHGRSSRRTKDQVIKTIVETTLHSTPADATQWSTRTLARKLKVSHMTVARVWEAHGLKPHRVRNFKFSRDKQFLEKLNDVVGLYLNPPEKALVLCVDEKSRIQALDRTQPGLPMKKGRCGTMTHDYKRNGTTCLFAALNVLEGTVIGSCYPQHRNEEFLKFLRQINRETPAALDLHLVLDNYGTHHHENVRQWLEKHPRFHLHFTPTSSSWLNQVERWFGEITRKRIRRGVFKSVPELVSAIDDFIKLNNQNPKPFVWTKTAETILEKIARCKEATVTLH